MKFKKRVSSVQLSSKPNERAAKRSKYSAGDVLKATNSITLERLSDDVISHVCQTYNQRSRLGQLTRILSSSDVSNLHNKKKHAPIFRLKLKTKTLIKSLGFVSTIHIPLSLISRCSSLTGIFVFAYKRI